MTTLRDPAIYSRDLLGALEAWQKAAWMAAGTAEAAETARVGVRIIAARMTTIPDIMATGESEREALAIARVGAAAEAQMREPEIVAPRRGDDWSSIWTAGEVARKVCAKTMARGAQADIAQASLQ